MRRPISRRPISHRTRPVREQPRVQALIVPRKIASLLLSVSIATLYRMEARGALTPIKLLKNTPNAPTFYRRDEIDQLISGA